MVPRGADAVGEEPWLQAERLAAREDRWRMARPVCDECGRHIVQRHYFPLDGGGALCPDCVRERMVEIDEEW